MTGIRSYCTVYEKPDAVYRTPKITIALYLRFDDDRKNGTIIQHIRRGKEIWMETRRFFSDSNNGSYEEALKESRSDTIERTADRLVFRLWNPISIEETENFKTLEAKLKSHYIGILKAETEKATI